MNDSLPFAVVGPIVSVIFPIAGTVREVAHGLSATPDGFLVLDADCQVRRVPGLAFGREFAYLMADAAWGRARLVFVVFSEEATDA